MYHKDGVQASLTDELRWAGASRLPLSSLSYEDVRSLGGATKSRSVRDSQYVRLGSEATYTLGGGVAFDVGHLARGEVQLGYYRKRYDAAGVKPDLGLHVKLDLQHFPTELTTVSVSVARSALAEDVFKASGVVQDANAAGSPGDTAVSGGVTIDHELLRNLILSAHAAAGTTDYAGIDRHYRNAAAGLGARFLINRRVRLELSYAYREFRSSGADACRAYDEDRVQLTTRLAY